MLNTASSYSCKVCLDEIRLFIFMYHHIVHKGNIYLYNSCSHTFLDICNVIFIFLRWGAHGLSNYFSQVLAYGRIFWPWGGMTKFKLECKPFLIKFCSHGTLCCSSNHWWQVGALVKSFMLIKIWCFSSVSLSHCCVNTSVICMSIFKQILKLHIFPIQSHIKKIGAQSIFTLDNM